MTGKSGKSEQHKFLLRVPPDLESWLRDESDQQGRTMQWIIEHALRQYVQRIEAGRKRGKE